MERFDVVVAGAGPAGSITAFHLACAGARVLLVDKARFPRDKPCGGGLTGRALKQLPVDPSPVVERDVDRFELRLRYGARFARAHSEPLIRMTQRRRLDTLLAEEAERTGAMFRQGWLPTVALMAMISLQLGVMNLLPIPVLDGGHIMILLIEGIARRDLSLRVKERIQQAGFAVLATLMLVVLYNDVISNVLRLKNG